MSKKIKESELLNPPVWTSEQLKADSAAAIEVFRKRRVEEPLEDYLEAFDGYQGVVEDLLESTLDLTQLDAQSMEIVKNSRLLHAVRYLTGPPISADDLKIVADAGLAPAKLKKDPLMVKRIFEVIHNGLDRRRFPWVVEDREPTEAERNAAIVGSAAVMAIRKLETDRRRLEKKRQEGEVMAALIAAGMVQVGTRRIQVLSNAPGRGEFCEETKLGERKADIVVGLWDGRVMAIECKVSNSAVNSVKRLNNDAAAKAVSWGQDFGLTQVVPAAVLSGVYGLHNLENAQARNLTIFWSHDIAELIDWIKATKL